MPIRELLQTKTFHGGVGMHMMDDNNNCDANSNCYEHIIKVEHTPFCEIFLVQILQAQNCDIFKFHQQH